jgi:SNF2 family DNA or RNA helicase
MRQKSDLRAYQDRIAGFLYEHDAALAVLRPGSGKTIAALTAIEELIQGSIIRHALVIAPKRVARSVWPDEILAWAHTKRLRYAVLSGPPSERKALLGTVAERDLSIIGIDLIPWLLGVIDHIPADHPLWDLLVIDEVSKLRDPTGKRAKTLTRQVHRWSMIWGLSGTLRPSSALDLFMPSRVVTKGRIWGKSYYKWRDQYFYPKDQWGYEFLPFPGAETKLNTELAPYVVTLAEDEVPQLPELQIILDEIELPHEARQAYDEMERKLVTGDVIAASAAVATGKLAQIANGFIYNDRIAQAVHPEKVYWLQDLIEQAAGPVLLIYEFLEDLTMMQSQIDNLPCLGRLGGSTDDAIITAWNKGELPFLALHPAAGGHGLNLQTGGADMAWLSPTWSPELWEQTIARLHRSGQTKPVIVRVCVARNTVDGMKLDRVYRKMSAQAAFEAYLRRYHEAA